MIRYNRVGIRVVFVKHTTRLVKTRRKDHVTDFKRNSTLAITLDKFVTTVRKIRHVSEELV